MLYLIYGTDTEKRQASREKLLAEFANAQVIIRNADDITMGEVEQIAGGMSLFNDRLLLLLESPFDNVSFSDSFIEYLDTLVLSHNVVIVYERELAKDIVTTFQKVGATVIAHVEAKKTAKQNFNIFSITDAFTARDKKGTWLLYREALLHEQAPEAIIGVVFWAIKNMVTKKRFSSWKKNELENASRELVRVVHGAHSGLFDIEEELERFILKYI